MPTTGSLAVLDTVIEQRVYTQAAVLESTEAIGILSGGPSPQGAVRASDGRFFIGGVIASGSRIGVLAYDTDYTLAWTSDPDTDGASSVPHVVYANGAVYYATYIYDAGDDQYKANIRKLNADTGLLMESWQPTNGFGADNDILLNGFAVSPDGAIAYFTANDRAVTAADQDVIKRWDLTNDVALATFVTNSARAFTLLACLSNGDVLAQCSQTGFIYRYNSGGTQQMSVDSAFATSFCASTDETELWIGSYDSVAQADKHSMASGGASLDTVLMPELTALTEVPRGIFMWAGSDTIRGSAVFGSEGTVESTRTVLFSLDGNANVLNDPGTFKVVAENVVLVGELTVPNDSIENAELENMAQATIKGRASGAGTGDPTDLTATQATAILDNFTGDSGAGGVKGLVPAPAAGDAAANKFLKANGSWVAPSGSGDVVGPSSSVDLEYALFDGTTGKLLERATGTGFARATSGVASFAKLKRTVTLVIDGGGSAITTGVKGYVSVPVACTITKARLLADQSGSIVIDVWRDTYANYPPTVADTITAAAKPTLSSAIKSEDSTLTGWTTSISAGDVFGFNVDSATTVTRVILELTVEE